MSVNIGNPSDKSVIKEDLEGVIKDNTKGKNKRNNYFDSYVKNLETKANGGKTNKQSTKNLNPNTHWKSGEKITNK